MPRHVIKLQKGEGRGGGVGGGRKETETGRLKRRDYKRKKTMKTVNKSNMLQKKILSY